MNHIRRAKDKYPFIIRVMKDYIIIGSGATAFSSAIEAVEYGAKVGMIGCETIGGTCVNIGCVPSKTLVTGRGNQSFIKRQSVCGIAHLSWEVDLAPFIKQKDELVDRSSESKIYEI